VKEEKTKVEAVTGQEKKTRGEVDSLDRVAWFYRGIFQWLENTRVPI